MKKLTEDNFIIQRTGNNEHQIVIGTHYLTEDQAEQIKQQILENQAFVEQYKPIIEKGCDIVDKEYLAQLTEIVERLKTRLLEVKPKSNSHISWRHGWDEETFTAISMEFEKILGDKE